MLPQFNDDSIWLPSQEFEIYLASNYKVLSLDYTEETIDMTLSMTLKSSKGKENKDILLRELKVSGKKGKDIYLMTTTDTNDVYLFRYEGIMDGKPSITVSKHEVVSKHLYLQY